MAFLPLHISKILRKKLFGRKIASFERFFYRSVFQFVSNKTGKFSVRSLSKVNAAEKFGVDF